MLVLLEADGINFWCSSPVVTRILVEEGARMVGPTRHEDLAHPADSAIPPGDLAAEKPRTIGDREGTS